MHVYEQFENVLVREYKEYKVGRLPGWKTSYLSLVTTSETKLESALAKNGTDATNDLQL